MTFLRKISPLIICMLVSLYSGAMAYEYSGRHLKSKYDLVKEDGDSDQEAKSEKELEKEEGLSDQKITDQDLHSGDLPTSYSAALFNISFVQLTHFLSELEQLRQPDLYLVYCSFLLYS